MLKVFGCFVGEHDLRLVALAATVCALATLTAVGLLGHAKKSETAMRHVWLAVATLSGSCGVWATHFIAVLAYSPGAPVGYNLIATLASLAAAILSFGWAFALALSGPTSARAWLGGALLGVGIAAMHYIGMSGLVVSGHMSWNLPFVAASVAVAMSLGAFALPMALGDSVRAQVTGALLFSVAVVAHHFIGMGAVSIVPDPTISLPPNNLSAEFLAVLVAAVTVAVLIFAGAGLTLDVRERWRAERESERMKGLADAAVEGLLVCQGETIVTANASFAKLSGCDVASIAGRSLSTFVVDTEKLAGILRSPSQPMETGLRHRDGSMIPVELILRRIDFAGRPHHALAVRDLRDRKKAEQRIRFLAHFDTLTGLPNRATFNEGLDAEIKSATGKGEVFAVFCLDLDRFKEVNDLFGHVAGDEMLQAVAKRVTAVLPENCLMARLGGDEFAILVPEVSNPAEAGRTAQSILAALQGEGEQANAAPRISTSIGIAFCPTDGADRQTLLNHADTALYGAKSAGRGTYRFFDAVMGAEVRDRRLIEHDLRLSIANHELRVLYQPQTLIETGNIVGFEALLRWRHPVRGDVSPAAFIPIAEESGSILQIGEWVMRTACAEAATWTGPLRVAVNVSPIQLHSPNYAESVKEILRETGLAPSRLEIEITETAIIRDFNRALVTLRQLKALGIRIAMDDFGTGYSSLSNLRSFPFDKIKIDGSFVHGVNHSDGSAAIVRAVLGLGRGLNLPILAEGVETQEELTFLNAELCQEAQGYLVGRPAPIETYAAIIHPASEPAGGEGAGQAEAA